MISRRIYALSLLLSIIASASPLAARECGPLKMLANIDLIWQQGNRPIIPVTVNGVPKRFLLDTGGVFTNITPKAVNDLHLKIDVGATPLFNASGTLPAIL